MKYFEFGKDQKELMVILHGGGTSYRGAEPAARLLGQKYHVVLVAYDGFNPSEPDTEFKSPMDEARRLGDYIVEHYDGKKSTFSTEYPMDAASSWKFWATTA